MTLRRKMDRRYSAGFADAMALGMPNVLSMDRYERWAYDAGWRAGKTLADRYIEAGHVPFPLVEVNL